MRLVSTSDRRARDRDRDAAIELVEAACAAGQIVQVDRDRRVEELRRAQTLDEIHLLTRDLQHRSTEPIPAYPVPDARPDARPGPTAARGKPSAALVLLPFVAVLVVAITLIGALLVFTDVVDRVGEATGAEEAESADVLSVEGYADLLAAVEEESGGTRAFDAVLYPEYAVVSLPVDRQSERYRSWYWDGTTLDTWSQGTTTGPRFDLAKVDAAVVVDLVEQVQGLVEEPTSWYAIVRAPDGDGAVVWAYASNEFNETAYLGARPDGTVTYDSTRS